VDELLPEEQRKGGTDGLGFKRHKPERVLKVNPSKNCKAIDGLIRYLTGIIPGGLLLSIARFRFIR
jgi:hypothetical protein